MRPHRGSRPAPPALAAAAALAAVACYDPRLSDCTVRCSSSQDCGPGQLCGPQGYCAAPDRACASGAGGPDPADAAPDAAPTDARGAPDGRPMHLAQLHLRVTAGGKVRVSGVDTCDGDGPEAGDCTFSVAEGAPVTLRASPRHGYGFERWTSAACATSDATCVLSPVAPLTEVAARFAPRR